MNFYTDRAESNAMESFYVESLKRMGIQAELNPAPEEDYEGRSSHDFTINGLKAELKWDKKSLVYENYCIDLKTLEHTQAELFVFLRPVAHIFHRDEIEHLTTLGRGTYGGDHGTNPICNVPIWQAHKLGVPDHAFKNTLKAYAVPATVASDHANRRTH